MKITYLHAVACYQFDTGLICRNMKLPSSEVLGRRLGIVPLLGPWSLQCGFADAE